LLIDPCVPKSWRHFEIVFRYHSSRYDIVVENPHGVSRGVARVELDGKLLQGNPLLVPLLKDGAKHRVRVILDEESRVGRLPLAAVAE
jgi:cyclic beta-1,2-glucan synthetase